jgi:hypothetical protein
MYKTALLVLVANAFLGEPIRKPQKPCHFDMLIPREIVFYSLKSTDTF